MSKSEENDVLKLIWSLSNSSARAFERTLLSEDTASEVETAKHKFFIFARRGKKFNADNFIKKSNLSKQRYITIKHALLNDLLGFLKMKSNRSPDVDLEHKIIEFEILLTNGLFLKACRKLRNIKEIAREKCNFSICIRVQRKAMDYRLFEHDTVSTTLRQASDELLKFHNLSDNLNEYILLSDEVLNFHFDCLDSRSSNTDEILIYLQHRLLKSRDLASSVMAKYYFYRIHSLIYLGSTDYEKSKSYSLQAIDFLKSNISKHRNDLMHLIRCKNNYLEASLSLRETEPFKIVYPELEVISKSAGTLNRHDSYIRAFTTQFLCNLKLRYLWLTNDDIGFQRDYEALKKMFEAQKALIWPSFKIEILLGFARLKFRSGALEEANAYCNQILVEKSRSSSLYFICGSLLRLMINFDREKHNLIPHLVSTSTYELKKRNRLFEFERTFISGLHKIKPYLSEKSKADMFQELKIELQRQFDSTGDLIIDDTIGILQWLNDKTS